MTWLDLTDAATDGLLWCAVMMLRIAFLPFVLLFAGVALLVERLGGGMPWLDGE